jgi:hypothetical protein
MCVAALPLIGMALSVAQGAAGYAAASQQAKEQNEYYERNRQAALAAMRDKYASGNRAYRDEIDIASAEILTKKIDAIQKRATAMVAAGDKGAAGLSVDALYRDYMAQEARQANAILINYDNRKNRVHDQMIAAHHETISRINSVRQAAKPSPLPFIISGLSGAVKAYS